MEKDIYFIFNNKKIQESELYQANFSYPKILIDLIIEVISKDERKVLLKSHQDNIPFGGHINLSYDEFTKLLPKLLKSELSKSIKDNIILVLNETLMKATTRNKQFKSLYQNLLSKYNKLEFNI